MKRPALTSLGTLVGVLMATLPALAAHADEFDSKGVTLHYSVEGKGEPVVLIHGLLGSAALYWELPGTIKVLAQKYRVISFDGRGHGQSGKPQADDQYGVEMVEDVTRLLDHLNIEKADLVGYSMGGMIALKFVVLHPHRVRSAILGGMGWLKSGSALERFWEKLPVREESRIPAACFHGLSQLGVTEEELKAVKVPISLIVGDRDPCKKLYVDPLLRLRSDWPLTLIEGAGHMDCFLKDSFQEAVKAGIGRQAPP